MSNAPTGNLSPIGGGGQAEHQIIDSHTNPLFEMVRLLLNRSTMKERDQILIDDEENILQALEAGVAIQHLFYVGEERFSEMVKEKLPPDVPVHEIAVRSSKQLFKNEKLSRLFAVAQRPAPVELNALASILEDIIVLEDVSISGNIGAMIRTCLALGIGGVVLLDAEPVDIYDRRLIRASRGYVFSLPVVATPRDAFLRFCQQSELPLLVTTPLAEMLVEEIAPLPHRLAIAFGSEREGASQELIEAATFQVRIPTNPMVESLNVSVAAGITLYNRRRFNQVGIAAN